MVRTMRESKKSPFGRVLSGAISSYFIKRVFVRESVYICFFIFLVGQPVSFSSCVYIVTVYPYGLNPVTTYCTSR